VLMKGGTKSCVLSSTTAGVTFSIATIYADTDVNVTIPAVTANYFSLIGEDSSKLIDETHVNLRSELGDSQLISIDLLYTNDDDTTETISIPIIQTK